MNTLAVYLTGFSKFGGQLDNPTAVIVEKFVDHFGTIITHHARSTEPRLSIEKDASLSSLCQLGADGGKCDVKLEGKEEKESIHTKDIEWKIHICGTEVLEVSTKAVEEAVPRIHDFLKHFKSPLLSNDDGEHETQFNSPLESGKAKAAFSYQEQEKPTANNSDTSTANYVSEASSLSSPQNSNAAHSSPTFQECLDGTGSLYEAGATSDEPNDSKPRGTSEQQPMENFGSPSSFSQTMPMLNQTEVERTDICDRESSSCVAGADKKKVQEHRQKLIVHLGLDASSTVIKIESTAYNVASFPIPDECGYKPFGKKICELGQDSTYTSVPIDRLHCHLESQNFPCVISMNPGRYVCNYIYYTSLAESEKTSIPVIFIHVPPFDKVPLETQMEFIISLLQCLCAIR